MTFIDDDPEYTKRHFSHVTNRTTEENNDIIMDIYMHIQPIIAKEINKYMSEKHRPINFPTISRLFTFTLLKFLDINVRLYPENVRNEVMNRGLEESIQMIKRYLQNIDLSGPRPDPKTWDFRPEELK